MKRTRKGFTLVELLIVISILGALSAAMSVASAMATVAAKASAINTNITNIKTAAALYQMEKGNAFKESLITADELKTADIIDLDEFNKVNTITTDNKGKTTVKSTASNILYAIQKGDSSTGAGAYVICKFADESDAAKIALALAGYKNIRIDTTNNTVGAFLYHNTAPAKGTAAYDVEFEYSNS